MARRIWHPVSIVSGYISIKGGYNPRGEAAESIEYKMGEKVYMFVELCKNAPWFVKGVGGPKVQKGELKAVRVHGLIRKCLNQKIGACESDEETPSAVAELPSESQEPEEGRDPMDDMDELVDVVRKKPRNTKRVDRAVVEELEVPTRPPCAGCNKDDKTVIFVYRKPAREKRSNAKLYLRADCIDWLLSYASDEFHRQGVQPASSVHVDEQVANCTAVADLNLQWNFSDKAWEARFVAGAHLGMTKRMCLHDLTNDMWAILKQENRVEGLFSQANLIQKKNAVKAFITLWCSSIARDQATEFEQTWGYSEARGEKRALEENVNAVAEIAVAADEVCLGAAATDAAVAAFASHLRVRD